MFNLEQKGEEPDRESKEVVETALSRLEQDLKDDFEYQLRWKKIEEAEKAGDYDTARVLVLENNAVVRKSEEEREKKGEEVISPLYRFRNAVERVEDLPRERLFLGTVVPDMNKIVEDFSDEQKKSHPHILIEHMKWKIIALRNKYTRLVGEIILGHAEGSFYTLGPVADALREGKEREKIIAELIKISGEKDPQAIDEQEAGSIVDLVSGKLAKDLIEESKEFIPKDVLENSLRYNALFGSNVDGEK